jgi:hypothetical protein
VGDNPSRSLCYLPIDRDIFYGITRSDVAWRELDCDPSIGCQLLTMDLGENMDQGDAKVRIRNVIDWLLFGD